MQGKAEEESIFSVKSFEDVLQHFKQCTPQDNTRTKITELEQFFDSVEKCSHSEKNLSQANDNCRISYERMITDLKTSVIMQKGESQNGCFNKKHAKFSENLRFLTP